MDNGDIIRAVAHDPSGSDDELRLLDHSQAQPMDERTLALVVESTLIAAADAGDCLASVEER